MTDSMKAAFIRQYDAAFEMIEEAIKICPEPIWLQSNRQPLYWYTIYHTLFWQDLYLSGQVDGFVPPKPFNLDELDPSGIIPSMPYTKNELLEYLSHDKTKCRNVLENLTIKEAIRICKVGWGNVSFEELLIDNLRHMQHHIGQVNAILRIEANIAVKWISTKQIYK